MGFWQNLLFWMSVFPSCFIRKKVKRHSGYYEKRERRREMNRMFDMISLCKALKNGVWYGNDEWLVS
ncbi:hypothetical protein M1307_03360 [Patescibacteria group bacterium]|nr:hypothetical protein [Patescibacteria group bacterium]